MTGFIKQEVNLHSNIVGLDTKDGYFYTQQYYPFTF